MPRPEDPTLFSTPGAAPLAFRMRPRTAEEYIGQGHLMGTGRLLERVMQARRLPSLVLLRSAAFPRACRGGDSRSWSTDTPSAT